MSAYTNEQLNKFSAFDENRWGIQINPAEKVDLNAANIDSQPGVADLKVVEQSLQGMNLSNIPQGPTSAVGELLGSTADIATEYGQQLNANVAQINPQDPQLNVKTPQFPQYEPQAFHL